MLVKSFAIGFIVKVAASFDDVLTRIPVIASLTRTRMGKVAFSVGTLLSLTVALGLAFIFSTVIEGIPGVRYIIAGFIIILAISVYSGVFTSRRATQTTQDIKKIKRISRARFIELIGIGFVFSFLTVLDDIVVLTPLFLDRTLLERIAVAGGIYIATFIQVIFAIYFAEKAARLKYKKEIAAVSLIILAGLIATGLI